MELALAYSLVAIMVSVSVILGAMLCLKSDKCEKLTTENEKLAEALKLNQDLVDQETRACLRVERQKVVDENAQLQLENHKLEKAKNAAETLAASATSAANESHGEIRYLMDLLATTNSKRNHVLEMYEVAHACRNQLEAKAIAVLRGYRRSLPWPARQIIWLCEWFTNGLRGSRNEPRRYGVDAFDLTLSQEYHDAVKEIVGQLTPKGPIRHKPSPEPGTGPIWHDGIRERSLYRFAETPTNVDPHVSPNAKGEGKLKEVP